MKKNINQLIKKMIIISSVCSIIGCSTPPSKKDVGLVVGGATGALIGSQFGGGTGKIVATGVGAVGGALIGSKIGESMDNKSS